MLKLLVALWLIVAIGSAETITAGNYSFTFDMNRPHVIEGNAVKSYDGEIIFNVVDDPGPSSAILIGTVNSLIGPLFVGIIDNHYISAKRFGNDVVDVESNMNLTDTIDFLKNLKVEPVGQPKP